MKLLIVETPAQAKRLSAMLGPAWRVEVYMGSVVDLPRDTLGIDISADFRPTYVVHQPRVAKRLLKAVADAESVYFATPPTVEAEAAAWRLLRLLETPADKPVMRVELRAQHEAALHAALEAPRRLDMGQVEAAETLRAAERLVGFLLSPRVRGELGDEVGIGYLDGLLVRPLGEHISAAPPVRWGLRAQFETEAGLSFTADLVTAEARRMTFEHRERADGLDRMLRSAACWVAEVRQREVSREPELPYTLATLIADAPFPPARTLRLANGLYERGLLTTPFLDDAYLLPTTETSEEVGDAGVLYHLVAERAGRADGEGTTELLRGALIRAWWERDRSVWLTFRARDRETPLPPLSELDTLRYIGSELVPIGQPALLTEAGVALHLYQAGACDLSMAIGAAADLHKRGMVTMDEGGVCLSASGKRLYGWLERQAPDLFSLEHVIRLDPIREGRLTRADALSPLWTQLEPLVRSAAPAVQSRPLLLYPLEA